MTNEEAIATLKYQHDYGRMEQEVHDALDMAIKALEQPEPCEDTISRQAAIYIASGYCHPANIAKELAKLPSVQPEIIRCGQCKYAEVADTEDSQDGYTCQFHRGSIWFSGSYCSWAERREQDE